MDITKYKKPIHFRCPKCGDDLSINGNKIKKRVDIARENLRIINAKMANEKAANGTKTKYYRTLIKRQKESLVELQNAKTEFRTIRDIGEAQLFVMFKKKLFQKYGKEEIIRILEECEEEMSYDVRDLMKQNYTNFHGA